MIFFLMTHCYPVKNLVIHVFKVAHAFQHNSFYSYCTNIAFYLLLKTKRIAVQSHPVMHRLYQYRELLKQLKPVDEVMSPQIESILAVVRDGDEITAVTSKETNHGEWTK
jgi:U3 small nucleolar RNA-associated protein 3